MTRRVITGQRGNKSVIISDEKPEGKRMRSIPGQQVIELWTTPSGFGHPAPVDHQPSNGHLPAAGETQLLMVTMPPATVFSSPDFDPAAAALEQKDLFPGFTHDPDHPGMHATPTVDYVIMMEGSIALTLEDGGETIINRGDVVVQCGALHGWRNVTDTPATMAIVLVGAAS